MLNLAKPAEFSAEPDTSTSVLSLPLGVCKTKQNAKRVLVQLAIPINVHQNANHKPIRSAPVYRAQCTLSSHPIYQTLLFDFLRVWF